MLNIKTNKKVYQTLRIAAAMCFIGHGSFGIITKPIWCNYFAVFGIGHELSYQLMPIVGCIDIFCGVMLLVYPLRAIAGWLVIWGAITASLRPLSGEPFAEFIERAGNYGTPFALLLLTGVPDNFRSWFIRMRSNVQQSNKAKKQVEYCLRIAAFLLILGHGWLNLQMKKGLIDQYTSLGFSDPQQAAQIIGFIEIIAALIILVKPFRSLIFIIFLWKITSELFYPRYELFEWIERGGSYGVLLALWFITEQKRFFELHNNKIIAVFNAAKRNRLQA